jgi:nucleoside-diphosphate-sugar epimerase
LNIDQEAYNDLRSMRVLVTGGSGYLGAAIVRALDGRGHTPVVFARRASSAALPGVACDGDVRDVKDVERALEGVDAVVHAAALVSVWRPDPHEFDAVNVGGLEHVLDAARAAGVARVVYTSSFLALPPAGERQPLQANDYQRTKVKALAVARAAAAAGAPLVILVPGVVYGPGARTEANLIGRLIHDHLRGRLPGLIGAERRWSYSFVNDVADAHVQAIERPTAAGVYCVGGENVPQIRIFEILRERTGRRLPRRIPVPLARAAALVEEVRARASGRPPFLTRGVVDIFTRDWTLDSRRSIAELDYHITPLAEGLRRTLDATAIRL